VWLPGPRDHFNWDRKAFAELLHFGKWITLSSALFALATNGDRLMLGAWVNPTALGYYSIALNLAAAIETVGYRLFGSVSMPALSEVARDEPDRLPAVYFKMRWILDVGFVGMAGFLFAAGDWVIGLLYDARYSPAGPMLQWLSFGLLFSRYALAHNAYLAIGRPKYVTIVIAVRVLSIFVLVPALFHAFGLQGAIAGVALQLMPTVPLIFWLNQWHGLNKLYLELAVLGAWPLGWLAGSVLSTWRHV
jgi:O-antigen/teichoic acid export membrane protein